jgi:two-component system sensor histidine kinase PilS (NtrC family)
VIGAIATRLLLIALTFAFAVVLEVRGGAAYSERTLTAVYALVLSGFLATLAYGVLAHSGRVRGLPWIELAGDGLLATGLVYSTGGATSVFGFLYVGWIVYATLRLGRLGAIVSGVASAGSFALLTWATARGALIDPGTSISAAQAVEVLGRHTAAFLLVGVLAHRLGRDVARGRRQLRELAELHRRIVDHMPSGLLTVNRDARISSFNREAERITGYLAGEVVGEPVGWLFPPLEPFLRRGGASSGLRSELGSAEPENLSRRAFTHEHRDGGVRHLGFSCATLRDDSGRGEGTVVIFQDLTRVVEMEEQLVRSERLAAVGRLAAGLAHEIRNPLASLSGSIELLEAELPQLKADARRLFRIVHRETERLNRLLTEFLHFARPEPRKRERMALAECLRELAELLKAARCGPVAVELDVPESLAVLGDPDRLRQVFWNLLLNAAEAEPADGRVRVRAEPLEASGEVAITVEDRGKGIPESMRSQVFDPFFTTKPHGTGLGLATVHRIVEAHRGRIQISSEPGKGTTVRVVLAAAGT